MGKVDAASGLKPLYSFDHLVIGPHNQVAVGACLEVVKAPGEAYNPLFVYGPPGVGKTHMMQAVAHQLLNNDPNFKTRYISAERFMNEILTAISEDRMLDIRRQYSTLDMLIIDDVQYMTESKISQEELFHIFNNLHHGNRQVILAADRPPNQLTTLNKNIRSRLEWGLSTDIKPPEEPTRIEILKRKQALSPGLEMTEEMFVYVGRNLKSNVRELEGFLKRLHAYVTLSHQALTLDLVRSVVDEILPEGGEDAAEAPAPTGRNGRANNGHTTTVGSASTLPPPAQQAVPFDKMLESIDMTQIAPLEEAPPPPAPVAAPRAAPPTSVPLPPPPPPAPPPMEPVIIEALEPEAEAEGEDGDAPSGVKEVGAVFFYPEGREEELNSVTKKFQEVIRKHKLKFRLKGMHNQPYAYKGKINFSSFVDVCKANKVPVAIVIGPPPDNMMPQQDFYDLLTVTLDVQGVSLQLINWGEINKDYRYLNLALDIALVRSR